MLPIFAAGIDLSATASAQHRRWAESICAKGLDFKILEKGKDTVRYGAVFLNTVLGTCCATPSITRIAV
jgi:hypothetical protein